MYVDALLTLYLNIFFREDTELEVNCLIACESIRCLVSIISQSFSVSQVFLGVVLVVDSGSGYGEGKDC